MPAFCPTEMRTLRPTSPHLSTPSAGAEPLKKKKRLDPAILKHREDRKRKRLEKQIRRLERNAKQLKPIDELEVPLKLIDQKEQRTRVLTPLSETVLEERVLLQKEWCQYKHSQRMQDLQIIDRLLFSQQKALNELKKESEDLYQAAIQIDPKLIPFKAKGPVRTPLINQYESPDGEYVDVSRKWE
ncbi:hypothetical protein PR048_017034 [Dryococelus australis]|uniref:Large ribosomal subunit protein mL40 n=1 Tax=Dryococelus australis TaxID=614101 RepID=A0ABQ9H8D5_9NEOP|nr:hypothetical protein PR048_017034 [Dryococelus australis]